MSEKLKGIVDSCQGATEPEVAQLLLSGLLGGAIAGVSVASTPEEIERLGIMLGGTDELYALWREVIVSNYQLEVE